MTARRTLQDLDRLYRDEEAVRELLELCRDLGLFRLSDALDEAIALCERRLKKGYESRVAELQIRVDQVAGELRVLEARRDKLLDRIVALRGVVEQPRPRPRGALGLARRRVPGWL